MGSTTTAHVATIGDRLLITATNRLRTTAHQVTGIQHVCLHKQQK